MDRETLLKEVDRASRENGALVTPNSFKNALHALLYYQHIGRTVKAYQLLDALVKEFYEDTMCKRFPADAASVIHAAAWDWFNNEAAYEITLLGGHLREHNWEKRV